MLGLLCATCCCAWGQTVRVERDDWHGLQVSFETGQVQYGSVILGREKFMTLQVEGLVASGRVGAPNLPTFSQLIEVPICDGYRVEVYDAVYDTVSISSNECLVAPVQPSRSKSDSSESPLVLDEKWYVSDAFMGEELVMVEAVGTARDRDLARLQISPIRYNPVQGKLIICRQASIAISYLGADSTKTMKRFLRYHSPAYALDYTLLNNLYPKEVRTNAPVRYLIVAHSSFRDELDDFVSWKRRKGFITDIVYTDDSDVGSFPSSIAAYISRQYAEATDECPAPTFVLLVGDHEQIPAFDGDATCGDHVSDLYYMTCTPGDIIPDCLYGRFSAQTVAQLRPQVDKTLMYEQYAFADPSFLDHAVLVAGVDGGNVGDYAYTYADPAMDYVVSHYINGTGGFSLVNYFKNDTSIVPTATNVVVGKSSSSISATVRDCYNAGAGWINYSAHGGATSWSNPSLNTSQVSAMTNTQKFGIMIGNCCLTNKFETSVCLGEALLRKDNYCGAVGYIGGSNSTYWSEDFYWGVGLRSAIGPMMSLAYDGTRLGVYDRLRHTHGEPHSQHIATQGAMLLAGNMTVEASTSSLKRYYWEVYHLMGDPSLMPYLTQADTMSVVMAGSWSVGVEPLLVQTVPFAYVALTDTAEHGLVAASYADAAGLAQLSLPLTLSVGGYEVAISAQQYRTRFLPLQVIPPEGPYVLAEVSQTDTLRCGDTVRLSVSMMNIGTSTATHVVAHFRSENPFVSVVGEDLHIDTIFVDDTLQVEDLTVYVAPGIADMAKVEIVAEVTFDSVHTPVEKTSSVCCYAPWLAVQYYNPPEYILPGHRYPIRLLVMNVGHAPMQSNQMTMCPDIDWLATATSNDTFALPIAVNSGMIRQYELAIDSAMPYDVVLPVRLCFATPVAVDNGTLMLPVGAPSAETFENDLYHLGSWVQDTLPWEITNTEAAEGSCSARSASGMTHNQTSAMSITFTCPNDDSVSFLYKVSSERSFDKFHFYIDGSEKVAASGNVDWTLASFPIEAGTHTYRFTYVKDYSVSYGSDCAWIDLVTLPRYERAWTLSHDTLCFGAELSVLGDSVDTHIPCDIFAADTSSETIAFVHYHVLPQLLFDTSIVACDSALLGGVRYVASAQIVDTLMSVRGCDSIVLTRLTINHGSRDTLFESIVGGPYFWNDSICDTTGYYTQYFETLEGCDSVVVLHLTVTPDSVGLASVEGARLQAYPNPTVGEVCFSGHVRSCVVYDMAGREVLRQSESASVDLSSLPNGVYTLKVSLSEGGGSLFDDDRSQLVRVVLHR